MSLSSRTSRSAVFLPTPGMRVRRATSLARRAATSSAASMPERIARASLGPTPETADQPLEEGLLGRGQEAEERERVLAHVGVDEQRDLAAGLAEPVEGGERDGDAVADAADVDDDLLRRPCAARRPRSWAITERSAPDRAWRRRCRRGRGPPPGRRSRRPASAGPRQLEQARDHEGDLASSRRGRSR